MKLLMTNDEQLSAADTEKMAFLEKDLESSGAIITHTAKTAFENATNKRFEINDIKSLDDSFNAFIKVKNDIAENKESVKKFDLDFLRKMKRAKPSKLLQRAVYEVEKNENFDAIFEALKSEKSGALFRAIKADKEHNLITVYSTRFGIWDSPEGYQIKQCETNSNKLRINLADRQESDITKKQDVARQNYPVATDLRNLFQKGLIQELKKDDNYTVTNLHFKKELTDEEIEKFETQKNIKKDIIKETSHLSKTNANSKEVAKAIAQNEKEIHSVKTVEIDEMDKYESKRSSTVDSFAEKLQKDLEAKQEREKIKLAEKIKTAKNERKTAKNDAIKLLAGGMTIEESINELAAKKYNDITIQFVQEDLKSEIIDSIQKESELKKTTAELEKTQKKLEETDEKRQKNYASYLEELERRKQIENKAKELAFKLKSADEILSENKKIIKSQTLQIVDLTDVKSELTDEIIEKDENIEILEAEIIEKDEDIKKKGSNIVVLENQVHEKIAENSNLKSQNENLADDLKNKASKIEELIKLNDESQVELQNLKKINKQMYNENLELKESLNHLKAIEAELAKYKKNSSVKSHLNSEIEDLKSDLKSPKNEKSFEDLMKDLDMAQNNHHNYNEDDDEEM